MAEKRKFPAPLPAGRWRVIWFGNTAPLPLAASARGIHTFFLSSDAPKELRRIERRLVSIAHWPLLHIGAEIDGSTRRISQAQTMPGLELRKMDLDLSPGNTELVPRSSLPSSRITAPLTGTPEYNSLLIRVRGDATTCDVFVPCPTLFLFFWAISSRLVDAVLSAELFVPERTLYNPDNTDLDIDPVRFEIRRRWKDAEAPYLVTLLKEPGAIAAGARIYKRLLNAQLGDAGLRPLEVWPPFARPLPVTGLYRQIGGAQLLTHITSVDLDPTWSAIELYREGGRRVRTVVRNEEREETTPPPAPSGNGIGPTSDFEVKEVPGGWGAGAADIPAVAPLAARFPALAAIPIKTPFDRDPVEQKKRERLRRTPGPWTAISGRKLPTGEAIKGNLSGDATHEPLDDVNEAVNAVKTPIDEQLLKFRDLLSVPVANVTVHGQIVSVQVDFWDPYRGVASARAPAFFSLPAAVDGENITWLYRDPDCRRTKQGICVRVTARDDSGNHWTRFIIDLERRIPRPRDGQTNARPIFNGLMVAWFDEVQSAEDTLIHLQIVLAEAARSRSPALRIRPVAGSHVATFRHGNAELAQILSNALAIADQCTSPGRRASAPADALAG